MEFSKREVTKEEYERIYADFRKIEIEYGVSEENSRRLNVVVEEGGEVVGFASGLVNRKWFNLTDLWVDERYRGQGLGAKVLVELEEDARKQGVEHIYTWTTAYNSNEVFYQKQGYRQVLVFEDFFGVPNGHHVCLRKDFNLQANGL